MRRPAASNEPRILHRSVLVGRDPTPRLETVISGAEPAGVDLVASCRKYLPQHRDRSPRIAAILGTNALMPLSGTAAVASAHAAVRAPSRLHPELLDHVVCLRPAHDSVAGTRLELAVFRAHSDAPVRLTHMPMSGRRITRLEPNESRHDSRRSSIPSPAWWRTPRPTSRACRGRGAARVVQR